MKSLKGMSEKDYDKIEDSILEKIVDLNQYVAQQQQLMKAQDEPRWDYIGDMGYVQEQLDILIEFLGG